MRWRKLARNMDFWDERTCNGVCLCSVSPLLGLYGFLRTDLLTTVTGPVRSSVSPKSVCRRFPGIHDVQAYASGKKRVIEYVAEKMRIPAGNVSRWWRQKDHETYVRVRVCVCVQSGQVCVPQHEPYPCRGVPP